jgi:hypothetical protein
VEINQMTFFDTERQMSGKGFRNMRIRGHSSGSKICQID